MYYSDPFGSLGSSSSLLGAGAFAGALAVIAILAFIALCVVGYIMLLGKNASRRTSALGRFFNFDHFYIEKVLQVLNLIAAVGIAVFACWMALSSFSSPLLILPGILLGALVFFVGQFINRIIFEGALLFVRLVTDTQAIRNKVAGPRAAAAPQAPATPAVPVAPAAGYCAPAAETAAPAPSAPAAPTTPVAPAPAENPANASWRCPSCGTENDGNFCVSCGTKRP